MKNKLTPEDRLSLRIPKDIVKQAKIKALANDTNITAIITKCLIDYINKKK